MRTAIVESGGKQYRAVEGSTIDVDRLAHEVGTQFDFDRVLLIEEGDDVMVGTPTVDGIKVSATVVEHVKGPKLTTFKYRPKKRIRVKTGHRQQYTRLMIDFIGKDGEERKPAKKAAAPKAKSADDLKKVEGIGPKVVQVLSGIGISTFEDLANAKVADIQSALEDAKLKMMNPTTWPAQAKLAATGDWAGLEKLQGELKGGRKADSKAKPAVKKTSKK